MTRLQLVTAEQSTQFTALRQFLYVQNISKMLSMRIQRSAQKAVDEMKRNTPEQNIDLFKLVSEPLRVELHYEINAPPLQEHPFFRCYEHTYVMAMRQICHSCVVRKTLHHGDLLFSTGETPDDPQMFFVLKGKMVYMHDGQKTVA